MVYLRILLLIKTIFMENQQQEKKSSFFFAYGSPQFVIGATLVNALLNTDSKTRKSLLDGFAILGGMILIIVLLCWGVYYSYTKIDTPSYSVEGYIGNWDWKKEDNRYKVSNDKVNFDMTTDYTQYLPPPDDMKKMFDNTTKIALSNPKHKDCKLGKINTYFTNKNTITMNVGYFCGGSTWVDEPNLFMYDIKTLTQIKLDDKPKKGAWNDLSMMGKKKQHKRNETKTFGEVKLETINEEQQ